MLCKQFCRGPVDWPRECAQVSRAIRRVDAAFALHGLQPFHAQPRPHVSVRRHALRKGHSSHVLLPCANSAGRELHPVLIAQPQNSYLRSLQCVLCGIQSPHVASG